jgi:hypothetical protein
MHFFHLDPVLVPWLISLLVATILGLLFRLGVARRHEERAAAQREKLERQILLQQRDLMSTRQDAAAWRVEHQQQSDAYRSILTHQLDSAESDRDSLKEKLSDAMNVAERRQLEHQVALQMCAELPSAKARVLELEKSITLEKERVDKIVARFVTPDFLPIPVAGDEPALPPMNGDLLPMLPFIDDNTLNLEETEVEQLRSDLLDRSNEVAGLRAQLAQSELKVEHLRQCLAERDAEIQRLGGKTLPEPAAASRPGNVDALQKALTLARIKQGRLSKAVKAKRRQVERV